MPRLGKLGKKKDSDSEDEGDNAAAAGGSGNDAEDSKGGGELKRGGPSKSRFGAKKDDSDSDDDDDGEARKEAQRKRKEEIEKQRALVAKQKEKTEEEEIEKAALGEDDDDAAGVGAGADSPGATGVLKRKDEKEKTRFSGGGSAEINREDEDRTPAGQLLVRTPSIIPWMTIPTRLEKEAETYMTLAEAKKSEKTMAKVREEMRKQGLYVARDRVLLPGNVERAIQRLRIRKARAAKSGADGEAADVLAEAADPNNFSPEEERFLVPFDPLKERFSRPAMRYDPYLPYLQYKMLVPATNLDSVFGPAEPSKLLDIEIRKLTFTDHPLFCEEDLLAAQLEALGRKYKQRAEMNWVSFYTQKIEDAKAALDIVVKERELTSGGDAPKPGLPSTHVWDTHERRCSTK